MSLVFKWYELGHNAAETRRAGWCRPEGQEAQLPSYTYFVAGGGARQPSRAEPLPPSPAARALPVSAATSRCRRDWRDRLQRAALGGGLGGTGSRSSPVAAVPMEPQGRGGHSWCVRNGWCV